MSDSVQPHELYLARLLCPWDFSGKNTGEGCCFPIPGDLLHQGLNLHHSCLLNWQVDFLPLPHLESPVALLGSFLSFEAVSFKRFCLSSIQCPCPISLSKESLHLKKIYHPMSACGINLQLIKEGLMLKLKLQ